MDATQVFLHWRAPGQRRLVGYNHGVKELDMVEHLTTLMDVRAAEKEALGKSLCSGKA